jgi:hypothetical protein
MKTTLELNRKELQERINDLYNNNTIVFSKSIPNGEIEDILNKNTRSLVIVYDSMLKDVELFLNK